MKQIKTTKARKSKKTINPYLLVFSLFFIVMLTFLVLRSIAFSSKISNQSLPRLEERWKFTPDNTSCFSEISNISSLTYASREDCWQALKAAHPLNISDWQTYTLKEAGITFKAPANLEVKSYTRHGRKYWFLTNNENDFLRKFSVVIYTYPLPQDDLKAWISQQEYGETPSGTEASFISSEILPYVFENKQGYQYDKTIEGTSKNVVFPIGNLLYIFTMSHGEAGTNYKEFVNGEEKFFTFLETVEEM